MSILKMALIILIFQLNANELEINQEHSKVEFRIEFMKLSKVDGRFRDYKGHFVFNEKENSIDSIQFNIASKSIDTGDAKRDRHLRGHEFFAVATFPDVQFIGLGKSFLRLKQPTKLRGKLKIKKIEKFIDLMVTYKGEIIDPWGKKNYFFNVKTELLRSDFNFDWNKILDDGSFLLSDQVEINIEIQAQLKTEKTAFSKFMIPSNKAVFEREQYSKGKIKKITTPTGEKN